MEYRTNVNSSISNYWITTQPQPTSDHLQDERKTRICVTLEDDYLVIETRYWSVISMVWCVGIKTLISLKSFIEAKSIITMIPIQIQISKVVYFIRLYDYWVKVCYYSTNDQNFLTCWTNSKFCKNIFLHVLAKFYLL